MFAEELATLLILCLSFQEFPQVDVGIMWQLK